MLKLLISVAGVKTATHNTLINEPGSVPIKLTYKHRHQVRYPWILRREKWTRKVVSGTLPHTTSESATYTAVHRNQVSS